MYNPDKDIQRFCMRCKSWYHTDCLTTPRHLSFEDIQRDIDKVFLIPLTRGITSQAISVIGYGDKLQKIKKLLKILIIRNNKLSLRYLRYMILRYI